ncbi:unnamed protein product [Meloidogyne enterolobii]|uniref:Uncharacterized protein n=1 Tax=Meloidogyne enterolobii TaxID=390850 RepID=A0ACB0Z883_MELEN
MNMASNYGYGIVTVENCKDIGTAQFYTDILATNGMTVSEFAIIFYFSNLYSFLNK